MGGVGGVLIGACVLKLLYGHIMLDVIFIKLGIQNLFLTLF